MSNISERHVRVFLHLKIINTKLSSFYFHKKKHRHKTWAFCSLNCSNSYINNKNDLRGLLTLWNIQKKKQDFLCVSEIMVILFNLFLSFFFLNRTLLFEWEIKKWIFLQLLFIDILLKSVIVTIIKMNKSCRKLNSAISGK